MGSPRGKPGEEYSQPMRARASEDREYVILGHLLEVYLSDDDFWRVAVDGQVILTRFDSSYAAWAVGAAESYRQGKVACPPPVDN